MKSSNRSSRLRKRSRKGYRPRLHKSSARTISPSKLWILLFVSLFPSQYLVAAGYVAHEVYKANVYEDPSQMDPMDYARFRRDAAVFSTAVTNLQSLSRIASAITLQIGLMDKTLDSQLVLPELLRMGAVKPSEITSMDPESVKASVSQLVELPKTVASTTATVEVEKRLAILENMRGEASKLKEFSKIPKEKEKYEESLKKVKELENMVDSLKTLSKALQVLNAYFESSTTEDLLAQHVTLIFGRLKEVETLTTSFDTKPIVEAKAILETSKFIDLISLEKKFRDQTPKFVYDDSHVKSVLDKFEKIYGSSQTAKSSTSHFETISRLMNSRDSSHKQIYSLVSGLPRGSIDLGELIKDVKNDWVKGRMAESETVTKNLGSAFQHFTGLSGKLRDVESFWKPLSPGPERIEIGKVLDFNKKVADVLVDKERFTDTVNALRKCDIGGSLPQADFKTIEAVQKAMNNLNENVKKLSNFKDINVFNEIEFKTMFDTTNKSDQQKKDLAKETFKKLSDKDVLKFKNDLNALLTEVTKFLSTIEAIKILPDVDLKDVEPYVKEVVGASHIKIYDCLANIQTKGFRLEDAFNVFKSIRSNTLSDSVMDAFTRVLQSVPHLTSSEELAKEFTSFKDYQSTSLKPAGLSHEASQALGLGVQGLSAIQKVFNAHVGLKKSIEQILKDPKIKTLSTEHQKGLEELKKLGKVFTDVDAFMQSFVQASRRKRASGFENTKKIFDDAAKIPGAILDFKTLRPAMEKLQKVKTLDDLEKLDLDFSRFEIAKAGPHLATLDKFFVDYARKIRSATPLPGKTIILPPNSPQNSANALAVTEAKELTGLEKFIENKAAFYGTISAAIVVILAFVGFVWYCCCCRNKKEIPKPPVPDDVIIKKDTVNPKPIDTSDDSSDEGDKDKGGKKEKKTKKKRSADNDEKKDDTSTEGPSTGGVTTPKAPVVEEKEKSLPLEKTQKSLENLMLLISSTVNAIRGRLVEGVSPAAWAENLISGHNGVCRQMMSSKDHEYKKEQRRQSNQHLIMNTLAKLGPKYKGDDPFININEMPYKGRIVLLGQGAQDGTEVVRDKETKKVLVNLIDTREKQYHVFDHYDVLVAAQLCQFMETELVYDKKAKKKVPVEKQKCGRYYPEKVNVTETYGKYEVTTTEIINDPPQFMNGKVYSEKGFWTIYKVKYMHLDDKVVKYIDIVLYRGFPDHGAMRHPEAAIALIQFLESYNSNMFIHCSAGVGRTGAMGAIMSGIEMCINEEVNSINLIIQHVRTYRGNSIQNNVQIMFVIRAIGEGLMQLHGFLQFDDLSRFDFFYQHVLKDTYDEVDVAFQKAKKEGPAALQAFLKEDNILKLHDVEVEEAVKRDRERLKEDKHPVKRGVNTTTEPEKKGNIQDDFIKQQADLYEKACEEGKEKMLMDEAKKEKDPKRSDEKKSGEEVKKVKETKKSEQKNPEEKVRKSGEKDTKKKAASKAPGPSKEKGRASKENDGAGKKK